MKKLDWDALHVFLEVHRAGSLAGAGRALGVDPTTVGRRLAAFEVSAGATLFTRTPDGLVATEAGEALVEHAQRMEHQASLAYRSVIGESAKLEGVVRVAMADSLARHFLVDHLGEFRARHPRIVLDLHSSSSLVDLTRGGVDLALRFSRPDASIPVPEGHDEVRAQRVATLGIGVYASQAYLDKAGTPERADEIRGHQLVSPEDSATYFPGHAWLEAARDRNTIAIRTNSTETMAAAVAAGFGIAPIAAFMAATFPNLVAITPPDIVDHRDCWLLMPAEQRRVARVRAVRDYLVELLEHWEPLLSGRMDAAKMRRADARARETG